MTAPAGPLTEEEIAAFERDGAVCLRGLFADWVEPIRAGIDANIRDPGPHAMARLDRRFPW